MSKNTFHSISRIAFGLLGLSAIITQLINSISLGRDIANFFSFFTIESNIAAAIFLIFFGVYGLFAKQPTRQFAVIRGAITLYMVMTGIIFAMLLSGNETALQTTIPWVNIVLHYVMPVVMLAGWLLIPPKEYIPFKRALVWLIFPIAYLIYSLVRGGITNWYPYPFINPILNGWPTVVAMSLFIAIATTILTALLIWRTSSQKPQRSM